HQRLWLRPRRRGASLGRNRADHEHRRRIPLGRLDRNVLLGRSGGSARRRVHGARAGHDPLLPPAAPPFTRQPGARMTADSAHFMYFPTHYRWSAEMLAILSTAPYGGADLSEVHKIGRSLKEHVGDDEAWFRAWSAGGDLRRERARAAEDRGHKLTAAANYLRACAQYQHAEHFRHPKDDLALDVFRRSIECFDRFRALTDRPRIEKIDVEYEKGLLPAYFIHAENTS